MERAYDAIVVGSGFGGGIAACRLAEQGLRVCVLERGRRFGPGDYPDRLAQFPHALWHARHDPGPGGPRGGADPPRRHGRRGGFTCSQAPASAPGQPITLRRQRRASSKRWAVSGSREQTPTSVRMLELR